MISKKNRKSNASKPVCHWRDSIIQMGGVDPGNYDKERAGKASVPGCDCASRINWYLSPWHDYQRYLLYCSFLSCTQISDRKETIGEWNYCPLISILLPVYKVNIAHLSECLLSVERQIYPRWELCVVEDGSGSEDVRKTLELFRAKHPDQVNLVLHDNNIGIARTSQEALDMASGEFVALLDHDDRLAPEALFEVVRVLNVQPDADWLYSDYDKISPEGERWYYYFKSDWSPDLLYSHCYIMHFSVIRRELARKIGGFRHEFEGAQDYDLYLRLAEQTDRVRHISRVLYSWRQSSSSTSCNPDSKPYSYESGRRAIDAALLRRRERGMSRCLTGVWAGVYRVDRIMDDPAIDLVWLDTKQNRVDLLSALQKGVRLEKEFYPGPTERGGQMLVRVLSESSSPYLLVISGDTVFLPDGMVRDLASCLVVRGVAAAAPKILNVRGQIDHCGLVFGAGGKILFPLRGGSPDEPCYGAYGVVTRNVSAVSPTVVLYNVKALRDAGGFDDKMDSFGAVIDSCLTLRKNGYRVITDGGIYARVGVDYVETGPAMHEGGDDFRRLLLKHPSMMCGGDPYYNRNMREDPADFGVRDERDFS
ncbi:MAG: glycosyltransferase [Kiritimatiellae bacterium]|nr:glycosyltransferase [Kiritimatiellia bacterium]MDD5521706.1 glycosyltransferase [Kiritimatiellia bacterium]